MILHANAALSRRQRERLVALVADGVTITAAALLVGCSRQTASKWVGRGRRGEGLADRSSRPHRSPRRTLASVEQAVLRAREELRLGPHPLGWALGLAASTVHAILRRHGRSRLRPKQSRQEIVRYERERPGELVHVDIKKLGRIEKPSHRVTGDRRDRTRGAGWQYVFAAIDDTSRLGFARIYRDESADSALAFLEALTRFYTSHGISVERILTDNGTCFKRRWDDACQRTRHQGQARPAPTAPQTNGKAERFIRTLLELWAYAVHLPTRKRPRQRPPTRTRLLQSPPQTPRPRRAHTAPARQQPL